MKKLFTCYYRALAMPSYALSVQDRTIAQINDNNKEIAQMLLNNKSGNTRSLKVDFNLRQSKRDRKCKSGGEQTIAKGVQLISTDSSFNHNYFRLFSSLTIGYDTTKNHIRKLTMSRRMPYSGYAQLNPFKFFVDPATIRNKNEFLLPITYSVRISHTYKRTLATSVDTSHTVDVIASTLLQNNAERIAIQTVKNSAVLYHYGMDFIEPGSSDLYLWDKINSAKISGITQHWVQPSFGLYSANTFTLTNKKDIYVANIALPKGTH